MKLYSNCVLLVAAAALLLPSCASKKKARPINVDTIDIVTEQSTSLLLGDVRAQNSADEVWVAYVGVQNDTSKPMTFERNEIDTIVEEYFVNARYDDQMSVFRIVSKRLIEAGMRAAGITRPDDLVIRDKREAFIQALVKEGIQPQYFMFGVITSIRVAREDEDAGERYRLSLEMMEVFGDKAGEVAARRSATFIQDDT